MMRLMSTLVLALGLILLGAGDLSAWFPHGQASAIVPFDWKTMKIGGGGQSIDLDANCDLGIGGCSGGTGTSTILSHGDGYGVQLLKKSGGCGVNVPSPCWQELITASALPSGDPANNPGLICQSGVTISGAAPGCTSYGAVSAPSNTNRLWLTWAGYLYTSTDHGADLLATNYPRDIYSNTNGGYRQAGPHIAVDPASETTVVSCYSFRCQYTTDGGVTWNVMDPFGSGSEAQAQGSVSGSVLTVTVAPVVGSIQVGQAIQGGNSNTNIFLSAGTTIASLGTGTGGVGTYNLNKSQTTLTGGTFSSDSNIVVAFDPTSVSGGHAQTLAICGNAYGGCVESTAGVTGSFSPLSSGSGPTSIFHLHFDAAGNVWVTDNTSGNATGDIWEHTGGSWVQRFTGGGPTFSDVALDPNNANNVFALETNNGKTAYSTNGGVSSTAVQTASTAANPDGTDVPWLGSSGAGVGLSVTSGAVYDPATPNTVLMQSGVGNWYANPSTGTTTTWYSLSAGLESLTGFDLISTSKGAPFVGAYDFQVFSVPNVDTYASAADRGVIPVPSAGQSGGTGGGCCFGAWNLDAAGSNPPTVLAISNGYYASGNGDVSGLTTNGGVTWSQFGSRPIAPGSNRAGGMIAAATPSIFAYAPAYNGVSGQNELYTSVDAGTTWQQPILTGVGTTGDIGWANQYNFRSHLICADRAAANPTFYALNYQSGVPAGEGIWRGVYVASSWTWTRALAGGVDQNVAENFNSTLRCAPGEPGELWYTSGPQSGPIGSFPHTQSLYHCVDTGTIACSQIPNVKEPWLISFGAPQNGVGYPTLFMVGWVNQGSGYIYGLWYSKDKAVTWNFLTAAPGGDLEAPAALSGDINTYGLVYISFVSSGAKVKQFNFLLKRDLDPAANDNAPMFLERVG